MKKKIKDTLHLKVESSYDGARFLFLTVDCFACFEVRLCGVLDLINF